MTSKVIKTSKVVDHLGTRYIVDVITDNGMSTRQESIGVYTDRAQADDVVFNIYSACVEEYGVDNVHVMTRELNTADSSV
ncbi:hypothetical protein LCGC14_2743100 [marine sediment metagenome]|uniref:Uncharacterized protein n=1 Tax=marine sediment metagenome TaxID=412755 RepID=A0A0F8ZR37_9ZZZZ